MLNTFNPFEKDISDLQSKDLVILKTVNEGWYVDYKEAGLKPPKYAKAIAAMANTYGGWVFVGIRESGTDDNVAGSFPGLKHKEATIAVQHIRQAVTEHLNPQPHFEIKTLNSPEEEVDSRIICIYIPASNKAPIIHKDGKIYRRIGDGSEPVAETKREVVDHLTKRVERQEALYKEWFERTPELAQAEENISLLRMIAVSDYWREQGLYYGDTLEEFKTVITNPGRGTSFSKNYSTTYTSNFGFTCRCEEPSNPRQITDTLRIWRDLRFESWNLIPSFNINQYEYYRYKNENLDHTIQFLEKNGYSECEAIDFSYTIGNISSFMTLIKNFQERVGYTGKTHIKFSINNVWRRIPVFAIKPTDLDWDKNGVPLLLRNNIGCSNSGQIETFIPVELHSKEDDIFLGTELIWQILYSIGMGNSNIEKFSKTAEKLVEISIYEAQKRTHITQK